MKIYFMEVIPKRGLQGKISAQKVAKLFGNFGEI